MRRPSAIPSATYRLQLHKGFGFDDARARIPYFAAIGVSHLYLSPIFAARAGSTHGYDVIDPSRINPELGGERGFHALADACHTAGLGIILDIVPNHRAVWAADNPQWLDVLEHGAKSVHAATFDIDFSAPGADGKVMAPILGKPYGEALDAGDIALIWDRPLGKLSIAYGPHRLPLRPEDQALIGGRRPAEADLAAYKTPSKLHDLLERQHFKLGFWRGAGDTINWRRFFDINDLAGVRVEDQAVFQSSHQLIFDLYGQGLIDGVRVDHIDGLADPAAYAQSLRRELTALNNSRPDGSPRDGPWIVVEKILGAGEVLAPDWAVDGTSGYDFMDEVSALQHDPRGEAALDRLWAEQSSRNAPFDAEETAARVEIVETLFAGQLRDCARAFADLAALDLDTRDLSAEAFRRALIALIAELRIYRGYATGDSDDSHSHPLFEQAMTQAAGARPSIAAALQFIAGTLRGRGAGSAILREAAARRLNQLTAPVAAKAVEDTAFYRFNRLLSRTDVGFDPRRFSLPASTFLRLGAERARDWPQAMLATATHDHKRGEDTRARLAVLSELPRPWRDAVRFWEDLNANHRPPALTPEDDYPLYQMIVATWPVGLTPRDAAGLGAFKDRLWAWRLKALREAKLRTSWDMPDEDYETTSRLWLERLLDQEQSPDFLDSACEFAGRIAGPGAVNGVVQAALRCAWPGVPDLYQGAELWDLSMVDPDNRAPVDFEDRERRLDLGAADWPSGAIKLHTIAEILKMRRADPHLFSRGELHPIPVRGERSAHVIAFERRLESRTATFAVMTHMGRAVRRLGRLPGAVWWRETRVQLDGAWRPAAEIFANHPVYVSHRGAPKGDPVA